MNNDYPLTSRTNCTLEEIERYRYITNQETPDTYSISEYEEKIEDLESEIDDLNSWNVYNKEDLEDEISELECTVDHLKEKNRILQEKIEVLLKNNDSTKSDSSFGLD